MFKLFNLFNLKMLYTTKLSNTYLCVKLYGKKEYIAYKYNCMQFDTNEKAHVYYTDKCINGKVDSSALIPVCKFAPEYFHPIILNYKLSKLVNAHIIK